MKRSIIWQSMVRYKFSCPHTSPWPCVWKHTCMCTICRLHQLSSPCPWHVREISSTTLVIFNLLLCESSWKWSQKGNLYQNLIGNLLVSKYILNIQSNLFQNSKSSLLKCLLFTSINSSKYSRFEMFMENCQIDSF